MFKRYSETIQKLPTEYKVMRKAGSSEITMLFYVQIVDQARAMEVTRDCAHLRGGPDGTVGGGGGAICTTRMFFLH